MSEAVPPSYTRYIGSQLAAALHGFFDVGCELLLDLSMQPILAEDTDESPEP